MRVVPLLLVGSTVACGGSRVPPPGIDEAAIDAKADPCNDFYQYACGGYLASNPPPSDGAYVARTNRAYYATHDAIQALIDETMTASSMTAEAAQLRAYNSACLTGNGDRSEVQRLLATVDGVTPDAGLEAAVAGLHAAGVNALFSFHASLDLMRPRQVIAQLDENGVGLPDRAYYVEPRHAGVIAAYERHIAALAGSLGVTDPELPRAVLAVERELAAAMLSVTDARDPLKLHHPTERSSLATSWPAFDWGAYFTATGAPAFTSLNVTQPAFFTALDRVLRTVPRSDLQRYLRWRVLEASAMQLDDAIVAEEYLFHSGTFFGFTTPLPRADMCRRFTISRLEWEVSSLYVARHAPALATKVQPMVDTIRDRLWDDFGRLDWLDTATRDQVRRKLDAMQVGVSAPADFAPYLLGPLAFSSGFGPAEAQRRAKARAKGLAFIGAPWDRAWFMSPITVNAAYSATTNSINIPAAILQAPYYRASFAEPVNYGAIGMIIGHELTHGFDDQGHRFDEGGALRNMWTPAVKQAFDERAQCVIDQYDAVEGAPGLPINGRFTVGENIADLGGLKLAMLALAPKGEPLDGLTDSQTFFLAYAQSWCANYQPAYLETLLTTDPHSPPKARVNVVLSNTPEFARAWSCREGQPMAPAKRCAVW